MKACKYQSLRLRILSLETNQSSFAEDIGPIKDVVDLYTLRREFSELIFLEVEDGGEKKIIVFKGKRNKD